MRNTERLGDAKRTLTAAVNRSVDGERRAAETNAFSAELALRRHGRPDLARRVEGVLTGDVTSTDARHELRTISQKLDAELNPDVTTASFVSASDGGVER